MSCRKFNNHWNFYNKEHWPLDFFSIRCKFLLCILFIAAKTHMYFNYPHHVLVLCTFSWLKFPVYGAHFACLKTAGNRINVFWDWHNIQLNDSSHGIHHQIEQNVTLTVLLQSNMGFGEFKFHMRPRQNERHFTDNIFKYIFFNENIWISIKISLKFVPKGPINNFPALVQIMA